MVQWAKAVRNDQYPPDSRLWTTNRDLLREMVKALDNLPVSVSMVKKSKIGKAVNQIYKAQIFDS